MSVPKRFKDPAHRQIPEDCPCGKKLWNFRSDRALKDHFEVCQPWKARETKRRKCEKDGVPFTEPRLSQININQLFGPQSKYRSGDLLIGDVGRDRRA